MGQPCSRNTSACLRCDEQDERLLNALHACILQMHSSLRVHSMDGMQDHDETVDAAKEDGNRAARLKAFKTAYDTLSPVSSRAGVPSTTWSSTSQRTLATPRGACSSPVARQDLNGCCCCVQFKVLQVHWQLL